MELEHGLISVDDHVQETPETWSAYMSAQKWGDLIPHLEDREDGSQAWVVAGHRLDDRPLAETGALMPDRNKSPQRWEDVPAAAYDPAQRLRAMDADGVDCQVLYPSLSGGSGEVIGAISDPALQLGLRPGLQQLAHRRVEKRQPPVHPPMPHTHLLPPGSRHRSLPRRRPRTSWRRHARHPLGPAGRPPHKRPRVGPPLDRLPGPPSPRLLPLRRNPQSAPPSLEGFLPVLTDAMNAITGPVSSAPILANLLFSRILTRFPTLKFVMAETSLAWGAYQIETADHQFERQRLHSEGYEFKPSELFRRQCYMTGWYDRAGLQVRSYLGVENILWQSNFPRTTSSWPNTRQYIERSFANIPEDERQQILTTNPTTLYHL